MKTTNITLCFALVLILGFNTKSYAVTPSQRASITLWLQQQNTNHPLPTELITTLRNNANSYGIKIHDYKIDAKTVIITATTNKKSNILKFKRILDTTFVFDENVINHQKYVKKHYYFKLRLTKAEREKRGSYEKSKHVIFKSKTQIRYTTNKLIKTFQSLTKLTSFCPNPVVKIKPAHIGARIKLLIYSYRIKISSSYKNAKKVLNRIANSSYYISMHNINLTKNGKKFELGLDIQFYQLANRRNNLDKAYVFKKVTTNKICN